MTPGEGGGVRPATPASGPDGETPGQAAARPLLESSKRLRDAAASMEAKANRAGVDPDEPLGRLLQAFGEMVVSFSEAGAGSAERVATTIENTRDLAISEVHKLKQATALANSTIAALKITETVVKLRTDEAVGNVVKSVTPDLINALRTVTVINERSWNRRQNLTGVAVFAAVMLGVFGLGYVVGGGDFRSHLGEEAAKASMARCIAVAKRDAAGALWCPLSEL